MNFAHISGQHQTSNSLQLAGHLLLSWAGLLIAAGLAAGGAYYLYRHFRTAAAKQRSDQ